MKHFLNTQDWSRAELDALLVEATRMKQEKLGNALKGKSIALLFFNPSMRTRTSFELGALQLGGMPWYCSRARMHGRWSLIWAR